MDHDIFYLGMEQRFTSIKTILMIPNCMSIQSRTDFVHTSTIGCKHTILGIVDYFYLTDLRKMKSVKIKQKNCYKALKTPSERPKNAWTRCFVFGLTLGVFNALA